MTYFIDNTDIILKNLSNLGEGKIIIANNYYGAFTYSWGSMGKNIEKFICNINKQYFADKLVRNKYEFNGKLSAKNIRKYIRTELKYELPYWKYMSGQKELRNEIKKLESCSNEYEFVDMCQSIPDNLICFDLSYEEEKEFKSIISGIFKTEPWLFIGKNVTHEYKWLCNLHEKLKKELN